MPRYKLTFEYDGTGFAGWQRQPDHISVQQKLEEAIERFAACYCEVFCAGRTDAGVHATGQVVHVDFAKKYKPFSIQQGINFYLTTRQISVVHVEEVADDFHARFHATKREYLYRIVNRSPWLALDRDRAWLVPEKLDAEAMHEAAQLLLGCHDFTSFRDTKCQSKSPIKTLDRLDIIRYGQEIRCHVSAQSFLHHQVRNMVGTLRFIGNGKWTQKDLINALNAKSRPAAGETAPPDGLYLVKVSY
jgi:tRNA pseudouridine38-40 synthase